MFLLFFFSFWPTQHIRMVGVIADGRRLDVKPLRIAVVNVHVGPAAKRFSSLPRNFLANIP